MRIFDGVLSFAIISPSAIVDTSGIQAIKQFSNSFVFNLRITRAIVSSTGIPF